MRVFRFRGCFRGRGEGVLRAFLIFGFYTSLRKVGFYRLRVGLGAGDRGLGFCWCRRACRWWVVFR